MKKTSTSKINTSDNTLKYFLNDLDINYKIFTIEDLVNTSVDCIQDLFLEKSINFSFCIQHGERKTTSDFGLLSFVLVSILKLATASLKKEGELDIEISAFKGKRKQDFKREYSQISICTYKNINFETQFDLSKLKNNVVSKIGKDQSISSTLDLCQRIMKILKGNLWISSSTERGLTFNLTIPFVNEKNPVSDKSRKLIAVVSADYLERNAFEEKIKNLGYTPLVYESLKSYDKSGLNNDIKLLFYSTPVINEKTSKEIKSILKTFKLHNIPVINIASKEQLPFMNLLERDVFDTIYKPISFADFEFKAQKALNESFLINNSNPSKSCKKILLIENDEKIINKISKEFEQLGITITRFVSEALFLIKREKYEIVLIGSKALDIDINKSVDLLNEIKNSLMLIKLSETCENKKDIRNCLYIDIKKNLDKLRLQINKNLFCEDFAKSRNIIIVNADLALKSQLLKNTESKNGNLIFIEDFELFNCIKKYDIKSVFLNFRKPSDIETYIEIIQKFRTIKDNLKFTIINQANNKKCKEIFDSFGVEVIIKFKELF